MARHVIGDPALVSHGHPGCGYHCAPVPRLSSSSLRHRGLVPEVQGDARRRATPKRPNTIEEHRAGAEQPGRAGSRGTPKSTGPTTRLNAWLSRRRTPSALLARLARGVPTPIFPHRPASRVAAGQGLLVNLFANYRGDSAGGQTEGPHESRALTQPRVRRRRLVEVDDVAGLGARSARRSARPRRAQLELAPARRAGRGRRRRRAASASADDAERHRARCPRSCRSGAARAPESSAVQSHRITTVRRGPWPRRMSR